MELRLPGTVIAALSTGVLATVLFMQFALGYRPCELCHWQRYPFVLTALMGAGAAWLGPRHPRAAAALVALAGLGFVAGGGVAVFHVGVEQHWWAGLATCGAPAGSARTVEELRQQLLGTPIVRCDEIAWSLFGISLAGYNVLLSLGLAGFALVTSRAMLRRA